MKVYVMTQAEPFQKEVYVGVKKSKKEAENELRKKYPNMRNVGESYVSDKNNTYLLFIHEEEI